MNDTHERTRHVRYERERKDPPSKIFPRGFFVVVDVHPTMIPKTFAFRHKYVVSP